MERIFFGGGSGGTTAPHAHPETDVTGLPADLAAKALATRAITAGTGLTGGGDLTADRTLTVAYGTAAGTATVGNDARLAGNLRTANNLSDVANPATALANLGGTTQAASDIRYSRTFSPMSFGAVGNGSTDDTAALTACVSAAIAGGGIIDLGTKTYKTSSPINISTNFYMRGAGYGGGGIVNNTSDIFTIASSCSQVIFENCTFSASGSGTSGGHVWNASNGPSMSFWRISGVSVTQTSTSHGIWYQTGGGWIDCLVDHNCFFSCSGGATVSPWSMLRAPGGVNSVKFSRMRCLTNGATVPFFNIDPGYQAHTDANVGMTAASTTVTNPSAVATDLGFFVYSSNFTGGGTSLITAVTPGVGYTVQTAATATLSGQSCMIGSKGWDEDIVFDHITWEVCTGGAIRMTGSLDVLIDTCAHWDTTATSDVYHFQTSNTGYPCRNIIVRGGRGGAVSGGAYNFFADSNTSNVLLDSFGAGWAAPAVISSPATQTTIVNPTVTWAGDPFTSSAPGFSAVGINTAVSAGTRLVGATASGPPTGSSNAYLVGDYVVDRTGAIWICTVAGSPGTWVNPTAGAVAPNIQYFSSSGTWTKPAGAKTAYVSLIGGGGGGGSGRRGAAATIRSGGAGGGGGGFTQRMCDAGDLTATVAVTIGTGGTGGAAVTVDNTSGNNGVAGSASYFGGYVTATGSGGGSGGTATGVAGGYAGTGTSPGATGASSSGTGGPGIGTNPCAGAQGGSSGGGITAADVPGNGAGGGVTVTGGAAGSAGVVDSTLPTSGTTTSKGTAGGGPGSGAASITTAAQAGAAGIVGSGGSGGGASLNGFASGAGGAGGPGGCLVITIF